MVATPSLVATKETELIPDPITPENLFDIHIKQIDTDLARYDKDQTIKGNSVRAINGRSNSEVSNSVPPVKNRGTRKSAGNQGKNFFAVEVASIHTQSSTIPNPKCSKKPTTWTKQACRPTRGKWSRLRQAQVSPPSLRGGKEDKGLGKRAIDDNIILPELPNKKRQVSKEDVSQSQVLAEAIPQPHQMQ